MERQTYSFVHEPTGLVYNQLLNQISKFADSALLVVRPTIASNDSVNSLLEKLHPYLIFKQNASEWPGTKLFGQTALVCRFRANENFLTIVQNVSNGLYDWQQPELPEDLCFLRIDTKPCLITVAHEREGRLILSPIEMENLRAEIREIDEYIVPYEDI